MRFVQFLTPSKGINRLLSLNFETFYATEEFARNGSFHSYIRPIGQHIDSANLTALETSLLCEETHNIAATYLVLLPFTYI